MTDIEPKPAYEDGRMVATGVRRLSPEDTHIFEGTFSLLHCAVKGDNLYRGVFAVLMFPIRYPDKYVSLWYTDIDTQDANKDKDREIGLIEDMSAFPEEARRLIRESLVKHYYERIVARVHKVAYRHGLLFFDVETRHGPQEFVMRWSYDRAEEYGAHGKVLLDAFDNRWIIPDLTALPAKDRLEFTAYIYW